MTVREHMLYLTDDNVRAVLRTVNPKTQTRRVVKLPHNNPLGVWEPILIGGPNGGRTARGETIPEEGGIFHTRTGDCQSCPYGGPGDRLWVREAWCHLSDVRTSDPGGDARQRRVFHRADYPGDTLIHDGDPAAKIKWRSSRFMPRWASRITLEIVSVRAERLHDISESDAIDEGMLTLGDAWLRDHFPGYCAERDATPTGEKPPLGPSPSARYEKFWDNLNAERGQPWEANPYVWRIEFRRVT